VLLAVDVGNTETHIGVFSRDQLTVDYRMATDPGRTADELALSFQQFLSLGNLLFFGDVTAVAVASVVPAVTAALKQMVEKYFGFEPVIVGPGVKTGISILTDNPREVGADRVVNSMAALELFGGPLILVDFGTATTFDAISEAGEYLGGAICPGVEVSASALSSAAAQLPRVELASPRSVIGKSTPESVRAGIVLGTAAMVDGLGEQMRAELPGARMVATGGLASLIVPHCRTDIHVEPALTLIGLRLLYERNVQEP
jgi:type III pantothenate kinase